jgi:hypothetical protein
VASNAGDTAEYRKRTEKGAPRAWQTSDLAGRAEAEAAIANSTRVVVRLLLYA